MASLILALSALTQENPEEAQQELEESVEEQIEGSPVEESEERFGDPQEEQTEEQAAEEEARRVEKQAEQAMMEQTSGPFPSSGGSAVGPLLLPAALLLGSDALAYAVPRRR